MGGREHSADGLLITAGDDPKELIGAYTDVTGRVPVMPEYGLGFWQCKLRYYSQEEVLRVAREYHRRGIPVDMLIIDYFHWPKCGDFRFEEEFFPDPEGMIRELKEMGMETMVSIWPQVDVTGENFDEMNRKGMLVESRSGVNIQMIHTGYHVFLDATNPDTRAYVWDKIAQNYVGKGVRAFWLDEAEPEFATYDYAKNFVYLELLRRIRKREIAGLSPWFGTDEATSGELDFFVRSRKDYKNYGLEVKRGNEIARTGNVLLEKGKLDYLYNLKDTYGGIEGKKYAVPLYLAGRVSFALGKEE